MTDPRRATSGAHPSSTGQVLAEVDWLDAHFEACRPEYEAMLRSVGIESGWRVLDAACGSGSFLPLVAELVGPTGEVAALDLAPENVAVVGERLVEWALACSAEARVGSLTALPYPDRHFDAVWCANVLQYFTAEETRHVLAELCRVVRPGGVVAVKDVDVQLVRIAPADPFLVSHLCDVSIRGPAATAQSVGSLRGRELRRWLEQAGLEAVWQRSTLIERWAPLRPVERRFWSEWLTYLAGLAEARGVLLSDLETWRALRDPTAPDYLLDHPEFYGCEGQVVAVGRVPSGPAQAVGESEQG
ncbi:MAG: class I SAM-dependent methyltransferase [Chloroflexi bacterium]|nr:class I SAM-dependent methyltransferase [Chloroflexota bacterium]